MCYMSLARLAQLAARRSHNPKVVGSIPTLCICTSYVNYIYIVDGTIGAVGSALVLCTEGPGFEPLIVHTHTHTHTHTHIVALV